MFRLTVKMMIFYPVLKIISLKYFLTCCITTTCVLELLRYVSYLDCFESLLLVCGASPAGSLGSVPSPEACFTWSSGPWSSSVASPTGPAASQPSSTGDPDSPILQPLQPSGQLAIFGFSKRVCLTFNFCEIPLILSRFSPGIFKGEKYQNRTYFMLRCYLLFMNCRIFWNHDSGRAEIRSWIIELKLLRSSLHTFTTCCSSHPNHSLGSLFLY